MSGSERQANSPATGTHALFFAQLLVFLCLVVGSGAAWQRSLVAALAVTDLEHLVTQPWTLLTYLLLNVHPLEFVVAAGILMLAGAPVERRLGRSRFLLLYFASAALLATTHAVLLEAGLIQGPVFAGSVGVSAALLTAYLLLFGEERRVGSVPFPLFYLMTASFLFLVMVLVGYQDEADLERQEQEHLTNAYKATDRTQEERWEDLAAATATRGRTQDELGQLLGLTLGALSLLLSRQAVRLRDRYRVMREIRGLQEEVDARARVEILLAKISRDGMESLTRNERKFLRYASRFYRSRTGSLS